MGSWCFWVVPKLDIITMVPIMRLRRRKRTAGVNQLIMEAQIEGIEDTESSNMVLALSERNTRDREIEREGGMDHMKRKG